MEKILLVRIGWMKYYAGSQPGDERPIAGGKYNTKNIGGEIKAFMKTHGNLYGAFAIPSFEKGLDFHRIDSNATGEIMNDVLLIFFAADPRPGSDGQVIVGWYKNAILHRKAQEKPYFHFAQSKLKDAVLLPTLKRIVAVPKGKNATGRANVFYPLRQDGSSRKMNWFKNIIEYVKTYKGPNLLFSKDVESEDEVVTAYENILATSLDQGYIRDANTRQIIENLAMNAAMSYFKKNGYSVTNVSRSKSYDLDCRKGSQRLLVEVKGTQSLLSKIMLTPNEVKLARQGKDLAMFIKHSIKLKKKGKRVSAYGGKNTIIKPWEIDNKRLRAIAYSYKID